MSILPNRYSTAIDSDMDLTALAVKTSAGLFCGGAFYNKDAAVVYLQVYDDTTIVATFPIPPGELHIIEIDGGIPVQTALNIQGSTAFAGTGAPGAGDLTGTVFYL